MAVWLVMGLFGSAGEAENARRRLVTSGVPEADIRQRVLHKVSPPSPSMKAEADTMGVDPFFRLFGDLKPDHITNGETALRVDVASEEDAESVASKLRMFEPLRLRIRSPEEEQPD